MYHTNTYLYCSSISFQSQLKRPNFEMYHMNTYLDCSSISPQRLLTRPNFEIHHTSTYLRCSISIKRHHSCDGTRHNAQIKKDTKGIPPPQTKESLNATLTFTVDAYMYTCTTYCIHVLLTILDIIMSHHFL